MAETNKVNQAPNTGGDLVIPLKPTSEKDLLKDIDDDLVSLYDHSVTDSKDLKGFTEKENKSRNDILKKNNKLLTENNKWLNQIYNAVNSPVGVTAGVKEALQGIKFDQVNLGNNKQGGASVREQEIFTGMRDALYDMKTDIDEMRRYDREEFKGLEGRKKLSKNQNENSNKFSEWIAEKGGYARGLVWLGKSIYSTIAEFMGSTLWEIIKTVLFFLLFDPDGTFLKSIWNFFKDVMIKIGNALWNALPEWLKNWFVDVAVVFSRIWSVVSGILSGIYTLVAYAPGTDKLYWLEKSSQADETSSRIDMRNDLFDATKAMGAQAHEAYSFANKAVEDISNNLANLTTKQMATKLAETEFQEMKKSDIKGAVAFSLVQGKIITPSEFKKQMEANKGAFKDVISNKLLATQTPESIRAKFLASEYEKRTKDLERVKSQIYQVKAEKETTGKVTTLTKGGVAQADAGGVAVKVQTFKKTQTTEKAAYADLLKQVTDSNTHLYSILNKIEVNTKRKERRLANFSSSKDLKPR